MRSTSTKQAQSQSNTKQLLLKLEEQKQQINQMDKVFFETQDKCHLLEEKNNELIKILHELQQRQYIHTSQINIGEFQNIRDNAQENLQQINQLYQTVNAEIYPQNQAYMQQIETIRQEYIDMLQKFSDFQQNSIELKKITKYLNNQQQTVDLLSQQIATSKKTIYELNNQINDNDQQQIMLIAEIERLKNFNQINSIQSSKCEEQSKLLNDQLIIINQMQNEKHVDDQKISQLEQQVVQLQLKYEAKQNLAAQYKKLVVNQLNNASYSNYQVSINNSNQDTNQYQSQNFDQLNQKVEQLKQELSTQQAYNIQLEQYIDNIQLQLQNQVNNKEIASFKYATNINSNQQLINLILDQVKRQNIAYIIQQNRDTALMNQLETDYQLVNNTLIKQSQQDTLTNSKISQQLNYLNEQLHLKDKNIQQLEQYNTVLNEQLQQSLQQLDLKQQTIMNQLQSNKYTDFQVINTLEQQLLVKYGQMKLELQQLNAATLKTALVRGYQEINGQAVEGVYQCRRKLEIQLQQFNQQNEQINIKKVDSASSGDLTKETQYLNNYNQQLLEHVTNLNNQLVQLQSKIHSQMQLLNISDSQKQFIENIVRENQQLQVKLTSATQALETVKVMEDQQQLLKADYQGNQQKVQELEELLALLNAQFNEENGKSIKQLAQLHCNFTYDRPVQISKEIQSEQSYTVNREVQVDLLQTTNLNQFLNNEQSPINKLQTVQNQDLNQSIRNVLNRSLSQSMRSSSGSPRTRLNQPSRANVSVVNSGGQTSIMFNDEKANSNLNGSIVQNVNYESLLTQKRILDPETQNALSIGQRNMSINNQSQLGSSKVLQSAKLNQLKQQMLAGKSVLKGVRIDANSALQHQIRRSENE